MTVECSGDKCGAEMSLEGIVIGQIYGVSRNESGRNLWKQSPLVLSFDSVMVKMINAEMMLDPIGARQLSKKVPFFNGP